MVAGEARRLQRSDPRKVRPTYPDPRWHEAWEGNPRIARPEEQGDFQIYAARENGLRPYAASKTSSQWTWKSYGPEPGEIYFSNEEKAFGARHTGLIVIEPHLKPGAALTKQWGAQRWRQLVLGITRRLRVRPVQLGRSATVVLPGADFVYTRTMREAAAVLARARAALLPEGGLHHVAAAVGCPAVVIFGGYIAPEVTGYAAQRNLFVRSPQYPLGCGMRMRCTHCERAMASITVERVLGELEGLLEKLPGRVAA